MKSADSEPLDTTSSFKDIDWEAIDHMIESLDHM